MTRTLQLTNIQASELANRLLSDCVITAVSTLSATISVELTRRGEVAGLPGSLTALKELALPTLAARIEADGSLELRFSTSGAVRFPIMEKANDEFSWILDVPRGIPSEDDSLAVSGDGLRIVSSFDLVR